MKNTSIFGLIILFIVIGIIAHITQPLVFVNDKYMNTITVMGTLITIISLLNIKEILKFNKTIKSIYKDPKLINEYFEYLKNSQFLRKKHLIKMYNFYSNTDRSEKNNVYQYTDSNMVLNCVANYHQLLLLKYPTSFLDCRLNKIIIGEFEFPSNSIPSDSFKIGLFNHFKESNKEEYNYVVNNIKKDIKYSNELEFLN